MTEGYIKGPDAVQFVMKKWDVPFSASVLPEVELEVVDCLTTSSEDKSQVIGGPLGGGLVVIDRQGNREVGFYCMNKGRYLAGRTVGVRGNKILRIECPEQGCRLHNNQYSPENSSQNG